MSEIFSPTGSSGSSNPGGMSMRRSKGCWKNFPATGYSNCGYWLARGFATTVI